MLRLAVHLRRAVRGVPLLDSYRRALGGRRQEFEDWVNHPYQDDLFWASSDAGPAADRMTVPVSLVSGWHDLTLEQTLDQYARLRAAGQEPTLMIGPWTHTSAFDKGWPELFADALEHLRVHLLGEGERTTRVRVHVNDEWRELPEWPPPSTELRLHLRPDGALGEPADGATSFDYDPADPTPSFAGQLQSRTQGARDNKPPRIARGRPDLHHRAAARGRRDHGYAVRRPLRDRQHRPLRPVRAAVRRGSRRPLGERVRRLRPAHPRPRGRGPGAHRARRGLATASPLGHRIRLQVSGGAHPRFARNPGTGEPLGTAVRMVATRTTVHHDPVHPSALVLPMV
nr:hypothetical protein GCM10020092_024880 [Actinoplanes digitatis]